LLSGVPHWLQNREPAAFSIPQFWQRISHLPADYVIALVSLSVGKGHRAEDSALNEVEGSAAPEAYPEFLVRRCSL
jgi:hypothetical protein